MACGSCALFVEVRVCGSGHASIDFDATKCRTPICFSFEYFDFNMCARATISFIEFIDRVEIIRWPMAGTKGEFSAPKGRWLPDRQFFATQL